MESLDVSSAEAILMAWRALSLISLEIGCLPAGLPRLLVRRSVENSHSRDVCGSSSGCTWMCWASKAATLYCRPSLRLPHETVGEAGAIRILRCLCSAGL